MATQSQPSRHTATILHLALLLGPLLFYGVVAWLRLRPGATPPPALAEADILRIACYAVTAAMFAGALMLRLKIQPPAGGEAETAWWGKHQGKALVVWALVEGGMLLGGVVFLLLGDIATIIGVGGAGALLMLLTAPGRLVGS